MLHEDVQVISVDDHVIEHERVWLDQLPAKYLEVGPHIVELEGGKQAWSFEGRTIPTIGLNAVAGKEPKDFGVDPVRFDEMIPGCYDVGARLADMDLDGVHAQMCFPSFPGSPGERSSRRRTRISLPPVWWPGTTSSSTSGPLRHRIASSRW